MAYYIFLKNSDNIDGSLYKIAENNTDLNNLNINNSDYKIIENNEINFDEIKLNNLAIKNYNGENINTYPLRELNSSVFKNENFLKKYIEDLVININFFISANPQHISFSKWNNYKNQLLNLNTSILEYPFRKTLEQYFKDNGQVYLNPLQIP